MYTLDQFKGNRPSPVIVKKYYRFFKDRKDVRGALFLPSFANYYRYGSSVPFGKNLDVLAVYHFGRKNGNKKLLKVVLHNEARVLLILNARGLWRDIRRKKMSTVAGLSGWKVIGPIVSKNRKSIPVGKRSRTSPRLRLPGYGIVVEKVFKKGENIKLPHPSLFKVNARTVNRYTLLFAKPGAVGSEPKAFPYPATPATVKRIVTGNTMKTEKPAQPNTKCPSWLHDLHYTESRDLTVAKKQKEMSHWRTWHPMIDPIYWCYYDHEHGSWPGGSYWPIFDYTAWKTSDSSTDHGRQDESHEGFKVYSFPLQDQDKFIVITVHMHLSLARRFTARHHTVGFAVLNKDGELEMELHMKMDFGGGQATLKPRKTIPVNDHEMKIISALGAKKVFAGRRFNVVNVDKKYPKSVDPKFKLNCNINATKTNKRRVLNGIYEQWKGPLNTCSESSRLINVGFNFDVRNPSTAMRTLDGATDETKQILNGDNVNRFMKMSGRNGVLEVGIEHCKFDSFRSDAGIALERTDGVFYTDPYFISIIGESGKNSVRQYIRPEFKKISFRPGKITPVDMWNGYMKYQKKRMNKNRRSMNIEGAVNKMNN